MKILHKKISKIKLTINTSCNLKCKYCFVKKTNEEMSLGTARKAVDLLLDSGGKEKLLSIYGGEPFMSKELMEKIIAYATNKAKMKRKSLIISVCTNGTLLSKGSLFLLKKFKVILIVSIAGIKKFHDKEREFKEGGGTYSRVRKNLALIFKILPEKNVGVSFCIFPFTTANMYMQIQHLISLGFMNINLEIIREYKKWYKEDISYFCAELSKIIRLMFENIEKSRPLFLNPISWELKYRLLTKRRLASCPFKDKLEVYPKGEMAFSPFLLNSTNKDQYIIGNVNRPNLLKFEKCRFNSFSQECQICEGDYFKSYLGDEGASTVHGLYHAVCLNAAKVVRKKAQNLKKFQDYIKQIKKEVCF